MRRQLPSRLARAGLVVAALAQPCSARDGGATATVAGSVVRVLDTLAPAPERGAAAVPGYVTVAGEERLALRPCPTGEGREFPLAAAPAARPAAGSGASATAPMTLALPGSFRSAPWLAAQPWFRVEPYAPVPLPMELVRPEGHATVPVEVPAAMASFAGGSLVARVVPPPDLARCDVVTGPLAVAPGATFASAVAVEAVAWPVTTRPIEFRVGVLADDGREHPIARRAVDPRRPDDRRWIELAGDLAPFAGRTVRLRLSVAPAEGDGSSTLPVWADPRVLPARTPGPRGVLLVSLDTLRAQSVGTYGAHRPTTPTLDERIGAAGVVFEYAYTTWPHTLMAHMSAFTGLYPRTHAVTSGSRQLDASTRTLPEILRAAGFDTAAFTEDGFVLPDAGFRRGFATFVEHHSRPPEGLSAITFRRGLDWLASHGPQPFFLFLHTYEVHYPYAPRAPYDTFFEPDGVAWPDTDRHLLRYEQEARYLDDQVAALLDALDALGLGAGTLVVVMSDHGEEFLEHGMRGHGYQLWPESTHVPLMMRLPGFVPAGLRIATPVSLVDVLPTILDAFGLPPEPGVEGVSLLPLVLGDAAVLERPGVFFQTAALTGIRMSRCHCIVTRSGAVCSDPAQDPFARQPLPAGVPCAGHALIETTAYRSLGPRAARTVAARAPVLPPVDAEREENLRALGYLDGEP